MHVYSKSHLMYKGWGWVYGGMLNNTKYDKMASSRPRMLVWLFYVTCLDYSESFDTLAMLQRRGVYCNSLVPHLN